MQHWLVILALMLWFLVMPFVSGIAQNAMNEAISGGGPAKSVASLLIGALALALFCAVFLWLTAPLRDTASYVRLPEGLLVVAMFWPAFVLGATWSLLRDDFSNMAIAIPAFALVSFVVTIFGCGFWGALVSEGMSCRSTISDAERSAIVAVSVAPLFFGMILGRWLNRLLPRTPR